MANIKTENLENEENLNLDFGFEDHGISVAREVGERFQKILRIRKFAKTNLSAFKSLLAKTNASAKGSHQHQVSKSKDKASNTTTRKKTAVRQQKEDIGVPKNVSCPMSNSGQFNNGPLLINTQVINGGGTESQLQISSAIQANPLIYNGNYGVLVLRQVPNSGQSHLPNQSIRGNMFRPRQLRNLTSPSSVSQHSRLNINAASFNQNGIPSAGQQLGISSNQSEVTRNARIVGSRQVTPTISVSPLRSQSITTVQGIRGDGGTHSNLLSSQQSGVLLGQQRFPSQQQQKLPGQQQQRRLGHQQQSVQGQQQQNFPSQLQQRLPNQQHQMLPGQHGQQQHILQSPQQRLPGQQQISQSPQLTLPSPQQILQQLRSVQQKLPGQQKQRFPGQQQQRFPDQQQQQFPGQQQQRFPGQQQQRFPGQQQQRFPAQQQQSVSGQQQQNVPGQQQQNVPGQQQQNVPMQQRQRLSSQQQQRLPGQQQQSVPVQQQQRLSSQQQQQRLSSQQQQQRFPIQQQFPNPEQPRLGTYLKPRFVYPGNQHCRKAAPKLTEPQKRLAQESFPAQNTKIPVPNTGSNAQNKGNAVPAPPPHPQPLQRYKKATASATPDTKSKNNASEDIKILQAPLDPGNNSTNKKSFPSLIVMVKPCLMKNSQASLNAARKKLDAHVKSIIQHSPQKLTEWLMQRGLLISKFECKIHTTDKDRPYEYKLGMYSGNKLPSSGGYVWIGDCCGTNKEISVYHGSIFENSNYPPVTTLKLIYHWSCQTESSRVIEWVKVPSHYLRLFNTILRSVCVAAVHEFFPMLGNPGQYVEVGIITLSAFQTNRVKIEIVGAFDASKKLIRMKALNFQNGDVSKCKNAFVKEFIQKLVKSWIHPASVILIDTSIDQSVFSEIGFKTLQRSKADSSKPHASQPTNVNVMNYLKFTIPRIFQTTICALSTPLIQQFLDELSWREHWGQDPYDRFETFLDQLAKITKWDTGENLIERLNKISLDPFEDWSSRRYMAPRIDMLPASITNGNDLRFIIEVPSSAGVTTPNEHPSAGNTPNKSSVRTRKTQSPAQIGVGTRSWLKRKFSGDLTPFLALEPKNLILQSYYYGTLEGKLEKPTEVYGGQLKCPLCTRQLLSSREIVMHIYQHVTSGPGRGIVKDTCACVYCLKYFSTVSSIREHIVKVHSLSNEKYCCRICQLTFVSQGVWIIHMWENHEDLEMPYICHLCNFRSSMHMTLVDHFHCDHGNVDHVLCPFCLKVLPIRSAHCLSEIVTHFQNHTAKREKKCPQCTLVFPSELECRNHLKNDNAHRSNLQNLNKCVRYEVKSPEVACYMPTPPKMPADKFEFLPPASKKRKMSDTKRSLNTFAKPIDTDGTFTTIHSFRHLELYCDELSKCLECGLNLDSAGHFTGYMACNKCCYATCCAQGMTKHHINCHSEEKPYNVVSGLKVNPVKLLDAPLKCSCAFSSLNPYHIAEHLMQCEKDTAFPVSSNVSINSLAKTISTIPVLEATPKMECSLEPQVTTD